jgi:heme/copper-type cytochrome/quinol oxidase subunit 4
MITEITKIGYWSGIAAFTAVLAYDVVQILQVVGILKFPVDEMLIYGTSLCIVIPFMVEMLAFHHVTAKDKQFWTHASLIFTIIYAVFVVANYVVQLATVIPSKLNNVSEAIHVLDQTPHSMFWDYDAIGYISMGIATVFAIPALRKIGFERWVRISFIVHALVTPLITIVFFFQHTLISCFFSVFRGRLPHLSLCYCSR